MADYSSAIMVNSFIVNFNLIDVRCMKIHNNEC